MRLLRAFLCAGGFFFFSTAPILAQGQPPPSAAPTLQITSTLVFLDVTVLDKSGHPVLSGLTKNDFTITEDKKPQRIFSFEAPQTHIEAANAGNDNPDGKAPATILVLDLLNSDFEDFAFIRDSTRRFLIAQPARLPSPVELMVIGNQSLELLQGYTRDRAELLTALKHLPAAIPFKKMNEFFFWDRFQQSVDALEQIALENKGIPGRKNVVWVGHGAPSINLISPDFSEQDVEDLKQYVHDATNKLVDARISLFVIYPGLKVRGREMSISEMDADADIGDDDPFAGDINFGVFANETGGELFYNRNDVDKLIARSELLGAQYYTLTYQPQDQNGEANGKFRRIRVTLRDRSLHVVTKAGYFAPDSREREGSRQQTMSNLVEAAQATIPFKALDVEVAGVVRHPDTGTAEFTLRLKAKDLQFLETDDGRNTAKLILAAVSRSGDNSVLASKIVGMAVTSTAQTATRQTVDVSTMHVPVVVRIPRKTRSVRLVVETEIGGRIGTVDVSRKTIDAAPAAATPEPKLNSRTHKRYRPDYVRPQPGKGGQIN